MAVRLKESECENCGKKFKVACLKRNENKLHKTKCLCNKCLYDNYDNER